MMKTTVALLALGLVTLTACKKEECHECHYENANNEEVELGEKCGDELENLEKDGYSDGTNVYEVHCHEH
ncbi:MAG: hypothetical protein N4A41_04225 [Crocinitomicaceae bacterium]|nr:hypothetical protein [Crocinitomicaceae bacterium]